LLQPRNLPTLATMNSLPRRWLGPGLIVSMGLVACGASDDTTPDEGASGQGGSAAGGSKAGAGQGGATTAGKAGSGTAGKAGQGGVGGGQAGAGAGGSGGAAGGGKGGAGGLAGSPAGGAGGAGKGGAGGQAGGAGPGGAGGQGGTPAGGAGQGGSAQGGAGMAGAGMAGAGGCGAGDGLPLPVLDGVPASALFRVQVTRDCVKQQTFVYQSAAGDKNTQGQANKTFSYAVTSGPGPFTVEVTKAGSKAGQAVLRPERLGLGTVATTVDAAGSKAVFTVADPAQISVEFDDDPALMDAVVILARPAELAGEVPDPAKSYVVSDAKVAALAVPAGQSTVYFPPGVHEIGYWSIPATVNQVYLADGAFVRGYFHADRTGGAPIKINGRGVLSGDVYPFNNGGYTNLLDVVGMTKGHLIEGISLVDSSKYTAALYASDSTMQDVLLHAWHYESDGLHVRGTNVVASGVFFHVNDDAIVTSSPVTSFTVKDSVFWAMAGGSALELGWNPHSVDGVTLQSSTLIHHQWNASPDVPSGGLVNGCNLLATNDSNPVVKNVVVTDISVDVPVPRLIDLRMIRPTSPSPPYADDYQNFTFTSIHLDHQGPVTKPLIFLDAIDATHTSSGFAFHGLSINGAVITQQSPLLPTLLSTKGPVPEPTFD
jgi:hypothetical protein